MDSQINNASVLNPEAFRRGRVHRILAHSYTLYFTLFLVGVCLDIIFRFKIFASSTVVPIGIILLAIASLLIFWAQKTSRNLDIANMSIESFRKGPYRYTRNPTHWGLLFLILGFGIVANAFFVIVSTLVSFLISKLYFLKKQEDILAIKYGTPYLEYKKKVRF